jgi:hypothetical protein
MLHDAVYIRQSVTDLADAARTLRRNERILATLPPPYRRTRRHVVLSRPARSTDASTRGNGAFSLENTIVISVYGR